MIRAFLLIQLCWSLAAPTAAVAARGDPWSGKWGVDERSCDDPASGGMIVLNVREFDLGIFEMTCKVKDVERRGAEHRFRLRCDGEGGAHNTTLALRVSGDSLNFLNGGFHPKRFVRCRS